LKAFAAAIDIEAPSQRVFAILCDVERWPQWTSTMISVRRMDQGHFTVGSRARVTQPKLRAATWQVTQLQENRSFTWATATPGLRMTAGHLIDSRGAVSHVDLSFEFSGLLSRVVAGLYGDLIEQYLATEARGLKQRAESAAA
jgi:uncharacterized membrane protein